MYTDDPSGDIDAPHGLARYRKPGLVTTGDPRRFVGIPTFLRVPLMRDVERPTIGLVGVTRTSGSRFASRSFRQASAAQNCQSERAGRAFGVPTAIPDGQRFFGNDHLDLLGKFLARRG